MINPRTLPKQVLNFIRKEQLWSSGERILLSVSGGLDSMVMLDILAKNRGAHKGYLEVITFDHGVRKESSEEVEFVERKSREYGLSCQKIALKMEKSSHFQEKAREERQKYWRNYPDHWIATAHHGTDQAETILFRFLRGTGLTGLRGMLPKQGRKIHPLLFAFREDLEEYASYHSLEWREDPSNAETWRGKVRELLPTLDELRPSAMKSISRLGRVLARDEACLQLITLRTYEQLVEERRISYQRLRLEHPSIQLRVLRALAEEYGITPATVHLEQFLNWAPSNGQRIQLQKGVDLHYRDGWLFFQISARAKSFEYSARN